MSLLDSFASRMPRLSLPVEINKKVLIGLGVAIVAILLVVNFVVPAILGFFNSPAPKAAELPAVPVAPAPSGKGANQPPKFNFPATMKESWEYLIPSTMLKLADGTDLKVTVSIAGEGNCGGDCSKVKGNIDKALGETAVTIKWTKDQRTTLLAISSGVYQRTKEFGVTRVILGPK